MRFIQHLIEPDRLILTWQAQDTPSRSRYIVGQLVRKGTRVELQYFFGSADYIEAASHGFRGYPAFPNKEGATHDNQVVEAFIRRLPPRSRSDFSRFLELRGINSNEKISDFALLGYTGARLPDDGFELVHPFDEVTEPYELIIEIAGFRYASEVPIDNLSEEQAVDFVRDSENPHDARAIRIEHNGRKLGYLDRGRLDLFHKHLDAGDAIQGEIVRKNGTAERPLVYVYTQIIPAEPMGWAAKA